MTILIQAMRVFNTAEPLSSLFVTQGTAITKKQRYHAPYPLPSTRVTKEERNSVPCALCSHVCQCVRVCVCA